MPSPSSILEEALASWRDVREGLIKEVARVPEKQFGFRPCPEVRSVRELVQHILEVAMMMTGELTREDTDFRRAPWPRLLRMHAAGALRGTTRKALLALLRSQIRDAERRFHAAGELSQLQLIAYFDGSKGTKLNWLYHGIAHEMYHRAQLTVYERLLGIEPALTRLIRGAD
jgi:uncharacterized damage-inducible protein DinB